MKKNEHLRGIIKYILKSGLCNEPPYIQLIIEYPARYEGVYAVNLYNENKEEAQKFAKVGHIASMLIEKQNDGSLIGTDVHYFENMPYKQHSQTFYYGKNEESIP